MAGRRCPSRGCPRIITNSARYCPDHAREYEAKRGTPTQRGYGADHRARRATLVARMNAGETIRCIDCGIELTPSTFDLGHTDDRTGYRGPQCQACNRSQGGREGRARQPGR